MNIEPKIENKVRYCSPHKPNRSFIGTVISIGETQNTWLEGKNPYCLIEVRVDESTDKEYYPRGDLVNIVYGEGWQTYLTIL